MTELTFSRDVWLPRVLDRDGELLLEAVGGADALHDPRTFTVPVRDEHVAALRGSLRRHILLNGAMRPLCDAAGIRGDWDADAAAALLDPILLGAPHEVDDALSGVRVDRRFLIAHNVDIALLDAGNFFEAAHSATVASDQSKVLKADGR